MRKEFEEEVVTVADGGYINLSITYEEAGKYAVQGDVTAELSVQDVVDDPVMNETDLYYFFDRYFDPRIRE